MGILLLEVPRRPEVMKPFSEPEQLKDQLELTTACLVCGKPLKKQAKGSLTGWIFDSDYRAITDRWMCSCAPGSTTVKLQVSTDEATTVVPSNASTSPEFSGMKTAAEQPAEDVTALRKTLLNTTVNEQWQITSVLDSGPMGTVYIAQDLATHGTVAIKVLRSELSGNARIVKRFLQECEKAAALAHHSICTVYASGKLADGSGYVVMDYVEGENLETKIRQEGFLDVGEAVDLFIKLTTALEYAHNQGVIHRGIKPTNILFNAADGDLKLADFGVAKAIPSIGKETIQLSAIADIFGDPVCMSPEQCLGEDVDQRSDVYSLACVMYYALTGKPPFLFQNGCQTAMAQVSQLPPTFKETMFNCDIPASVEAVVMRALEKDPEDRYQTMAQLRADLEILKRGGTPTVPKPKRAGKRRVLQLPRADVVSTKPRELLAPTGTAVSAAANAVVKVPLPPDRRRTDWIIAGFLLILALMAIFLTIHFGASPTLQSPNQVPVPLKVSQSLQKDQSHDSRQLVDSAQYFYDAGNFQRALVRSNEALEIQPNNETALLLRGLSCVELGRPADAIRDFNQVIQTNPSNDVAYGGLAAAYLMKGRYDYAVAVASQAIKLKPAARYYDTRAEVNTQLGEDDKAISDYTEAIKIDSKDVFALTNRADLYTTQKKYNLAQADYDRLLSIDKSDADSYAARGMMFAESGQYDKSLQDAETALRFDPHCADAWNTKGYAKFRQAKTDSVADTALLKDAVSDFSQAIRLNPEEGEYYYYRSLAHSRLGDKEKAVYDANKASELGYE